MTSLNRRPRLFLTPFWILVMAGVLGGCSGLRPYESTLPPNLNVTAKLKSGGVLSSSAPLVSNFGADLHVAGVDARCQRTYQGSVRLKSVPARLGLPADRPSYLVVEFSGHNFLTRGGASSSYATLLTPRRGYQYDMEVTYADEMYRVTVHERDPRSGQRREVEHRPIGACKAD